MKKTNKEKNVSKVVAGPLAEAAIAFAKFTKEQPYFRKCGVKKKSEK